MRGLRRALVLALLLLGAPPPAHAEGQDCPRWRAAFSGMPVRMVVLETGRRTIAVRVKVADTVERQAAGFQCATPQEIQQTLILFDFRDEIHTQFHMQNVPAGLDIAFAKTDGKIFSILGMAPSPTALYGPMGHFRYALEARRGFFESQGVRQGEARLLIPSSP